MHAEKKSIQYWQQKHLLHFQPTHHLHTDCLSNVSNCVELNDLFVWRGLCCFLPSLSHAKLNENNLYLCLMIKQISVASEAHPRHNVTSSPTKDEVKLCGGKQTSVDKKRWHWYRYCTHTHSRNGYPAQEGKSHESFLLENMFNKRLKPYMHILITWSISTVIPPPSRTNHSSFPFVQRPCSGHGLFAAESSQQKVQSYIGHRWRYLQCHQQHLLSFSEQKHTAFPSGPLHRHSMSQRVRSKPLKDFLCFSQHLLSIYPPLKAPGHG